MAYLIESAHEYHSRAAETTVHSAAYASQRIMRAARASMPSVLVNTLPTHESLSAEELSDAEPLFFDIPARDADKSQRIRAI